MIIPLDVARGLRPVPENVVRDAAESVGGETNRWKELLERVEIFRLAEAHPIILTNSDASQWAVSSEETFMKKLH